MTVADHLLVEVYTVVPIVHDALLFDIPVGGIEGYADEVGSEVSEKDVVEGGVEAHGLELYVVVDFVGQFEIVHL